MESATQGAIVLACALTAAALVATLVLRAKARQRVGRVIAFESPRDFGQALRWAWIVASLVVVGAQWSADPTPLTLVLIGLAAFLAAATPGVDAQFCGERGVVRGWHARAFADLEEWRLAGEHLRWKLHGEWQACRVPPQLHADLRERLKAACPDRESPFA